MVELPKGNEAGSPTDLGNTDTFSELSLLFPQTFSYFSHMCVCLHAVLFFPLAGLRPGGKVKLLHSSSLLAAERWDWWIACDDRVSLQAAELRITHSVFAQWGTAARLWSCGLVCYTLDALSPLTSDPFIFPPTLALFDSQGVTKRCSENRTVTDTAFEIPTNRLQSFLYWHQFGECN